MSILKKIWDLPNTVKERIYIYLGLTGYTIDVNWQNVSIWEANEYPEDLYNNPKELACFHELKCTINRREDYYTLEEYWESSCSRFQVHCGRSCNGSRQPDPWGRVETPCRKYSTPDCEHGSDGTCLDWLNTWQDSDCIEFFRIAWERNHFRVCSSSPGGLQQLFNFTPRTPWGEHALSKLGTLTIRLDGEPVDAIEPADEWERLEKLEYVRLRSRYGKKALKDWKDLVQRLGALIQPGHLTLNLIVNVFDAHTAEVVLKPLEQLPTLKDCSIWLNPNPKPELLALIHKTIQHVTTSRSGTSQGFFRYLDLPYELRSRILYFTDLVSCHAVIEWTPSSSSFGDLRSATCQCEGVLGQNNNHLQGCRYYKMDQSSSTEQCLDVVRVDTPSNLYLRRKGVDNMWASCMKTCWGFCVCRYHGKHSAGSSAGKPKLGVNPLFLVSRQVREDAIPVFFRENRFSIISPGTVPLGLDRDRHDYLRLESQIVRMHQVELSVFLETIPAGALRHLRHIEWVIPDFKGFRALSGFPQQDYLQAIDKMAHTTNLSQLTLVLNMRGICGTYDGSHLIWPSREPGVRKIYDMLLKPLAQLRGLKDCFIYLRKLCNVKEHWLDYFADTDEVRYEKYIMNPTYDSARRRKPGAERFEHRFRRLNRPYPMVEVGVPNRYD